MVYSLLVFTLNEIDCVKFVLPQIDRKLLDEILIVDGGSTDGTVEYAESQGFSVYRQKEKGLIAAYREAIQACKGDAFIIFTPDGNMLPEKLPELIAKMNEGYDIVIVSRYKDGAKSEDDSLVSGFGNWLFTTLVDVLFNANYTDVLGAYRAYKRDIFERTGIQVKQRPVETRICIRAKRLGLKVAEIAGDEPKRLGGKSYRKIIKNGFNELFIIIEEYFGISSKYVDKFLKF